jgi:hypothetical protein
MLGILIISLRHIVISLFIFDFTCFVCLKTMKVKFFGSLTYFSGYQASQAVFWQKTDEDIFGRGCKQ